VIPAAPFTPSASPSCQDVPMLIGTNHDEAALFGGKSGVSSSFLPEKTNRHRITHEKTN
jgi:carboxylesterase type B